MEGSGTVVDVVHIPTSLDNKRTVIGFAVKNPEGIVSVHLTSQKNLQAGTKLTWKRKRGSGKMGLFVTIFGATGHGRMPRKIATKRSGKPFFVPEEIRANVAVLAKMTKQEIKDTIHKYFTRVDEVTKIAALSKTGSNDKLPALLHLWNQCTVTIDSLSSLKIRNRAQKAKFRIFDSLYTELKLTFSKPRTARAARSHTVNNFELMARNLTEALLFSAMNAKEFENEKDLKLLADEVIQSSETTENTDHEDMESDYEQERNANAKSEEATNSRKWVRALTVYICLQAVFQSTSGELQMKIFKLQEKCYKVERKCSEENEKLNKNRAKCVELCSVIRYVLFQAKQKISTSDYYEIVYSVFNGMKEFTNYPEIYNEFAHSAQRQYVKNPDKFLGFIEVLKKDPPNLEREFDLTTLSNFID